jgi:hypothetical protein
MVCAAGGCKVVVELLRIWAQERKGRILRIRQGDPELELRGGLRNEDVEAIVRLFARRFGNLKPPLRG